MATSWGAGHCCPQRFRRWLLCKHARVADQRWGWMWSVWRLNLAWYLEGRLRKHQTRGGGGGLHYLICARSPWRHLLYLKHGIHLAKLKWSIPVLLTALLSGGANYMFLKLIISYWEQRIATCSEKTKHTMPNDINRKLPVLTKSNEMQFRWQ